MMKNFLKISIPAGISIILSIFLYNYLSALFEQMIRDIESDYRPRFDYSLYFFCFTYLFALIALPFIIAVLSEKSMVRKGAVGMKLLVIEVLTLILVGLLSPPDLLSKILQFGIWQLPIAANFISFAVISKKSIPKKK